MRLKKREFLFDKGSFSKTKTCEKIDDQIEKAINNVTWPPGSSIFTINPGKHINGVSPIKEAFFDYLEDEGWETEKRLDIAVHKRPGPIDGVYQIEDHYFAIEWETGNISSSHRAINKMCVGILERKLKGGALVLPSGELYPHLTDRVGNYPELEPYFPVWKSLEVDEGLLVIYVVEHDSTDESVPTIEKGTDGRALV